MTRTLPGLGFGIGSNLRVWVDLGELSKAVAYESADVLAIAGMESPSNTYAGLTGTAAASVSTSATAAYVGEFTAIYYRVGGAQNKAWNVIGDLTTNVNFGSGLLSASGTGTSSSSLSVDGTISGVNFNGTADFDAFESGGIVVIPMTGGFYGASTLAGIYQGDTVAGVFYGIAP